MTEFKKFYREDLIFKSKAKTKEEVFEEIGQILIDKDLVTEEFPSEIIKRENSFPTGLDLGIVVEDADNVAIPHTEIEYCKSKNIVFVKLDNEITFNNMIKPQEELKVKYLFMIINNEATNQTNVLSNLMEFLTNKDNIYTLNELVDNQKIYDFLAGK